MQLLSLQIWESNIHSLSLTKKKKAAKRWPCYSGEWKQARHGKYLSLLLDVFSVWKPWHWGIKKKWKGEETQRERRYFQKKKRGGGKGKFEWFLCTRKKIGERQTTVWTFQGGDTLVTSSTHFPSFTRLSDKSPPLPNATETWRDTKCELSFIVIVLQDCLFMTRQGETLTAGVLIPVWVQ